MECPICHQELSDSELALNHQWHTECEVCFWCKSSLPNHEQITKCLSEGRPVSHDLCFKNQIAKDFREHKLPLYQAHIDALNDEMLSVYPPINPEQVDFEALNKLLHRIKECAANVDYALSLTKDKLRIQNNNEWREQETEKAKERRKEKAEESVKKAISAERQEMLKAEREDPSLKLKRKFIEGLTKIGIKQEQAEAQYEKMTGSKGKPQ